MVTDSKIVMCKIPREDFTRFQRYCDMNDETSNACLKRMISEKIDNPQPERIAGKSFFEYNKQKDNFSWKVILDDNSNVTIDDNLPAETVEHLLESLMDAIDKRRSIIKKTTSNSVSIPTKLVGREK